MLFPLASIRRCVISVEQFRTLSRHCSICTEHIPNRCLHSWIPCPFSDCRLTAVLCAIIRKHKAKKWTNKRKYSSPRCMILSQREREKEIGRLECREGFICVASAAAAAARVCREICHKDDGQTDSKEPNIVMPPAIYSLLAYTRRLVLRRSEKRPGDQRRSWPVTTREGR